MDDMNRPNESRGFSIGGLLRGGLSLVGAVTGLPLSGRSRAPAQRPAGSRIAQRFTSKRFIGAGSAKCPRGTVPDGKGGCMSADPRARPPSQQGLVSPRRRMNVANTKALRRASRRVNGFVKVATRALEGTGFKVVRRTTTKKVGPRTIVESGPGSVVTR